MTSQYHQKANYGLPAYHASAALFPLPSILGNIVRGHCAAVYLCQNGGHEQELGCTQEFAASIPMPGVHYRAYMQHIPMH